ncbi:unnamed protein product, partial [Brenthis ino]
MALPSAIFTIALLLIATGIGLLSIIRTGYSKEHIIDYTDCIKEYSDDNITCKDYRKKERDTCVCFYDFNLTEDFDGKVIIYYELESYNQLRSDYVNSKDDSQLQGILNTIPSENCEPYRYNEDKKPIAPCGIIADTIFNDTFSILDNSDNTNVNYKLSGMLTDADKLGFRNPENITEAQNYFAKPKNWRKSIWELDLNNIENNGFQNEMFIGWMKTDWKRKPRGLLTRDLPSGDYSLRVAYHYPPSMYDGRRKVIIESTSTSVNIVLAVVGSIMIVLGLTALIVMIYFMRKPVKGTHTPEANVTIINPKNNSSADADSPEEIRLTADK